MKNINNTYLYDIAAIILAYLRDEVDEEGSIGEIGKEILTILVESKKLFLDEGGKVEASKLLDGSLLFGLPQERVIKEIFKLEKIGLCVREQYIDFYNRKRCYNIKAYRWFKKRGGRL